MRKAVLKLAVAIKDCLKTINCCRSSCLNQTIETINIEHLDTILSSVEQLKEAVEEIRRNSVRMTVI